MTRALITGVTGQDGAYLSQLLLGKGYKVYGTARHISAPNLARLRALGIDCGVHLLSCDLSDAAAVRSVIQEAQPDEVYNLAAQSVPAASLVEPFETVEINATGALRLLEALRAIKPDARLCQASSSEMFGKVVSPTQNESTPFQPRNPYAVAKLFAHWMTVSYREVHGLFACCAILFNHESPLRGPEFVSRKISQGAARIKHGFASELHLGNLDARRDWGFAGDYVRAMWLMLQQDEPDDYVVATGEGHSVQEFAALAFRHVRLDWRAYVRVDPSLRRPAESGLLVGDATKARTVLGWKPKVSFVDLVHMMVDTDVANVERPEGEVLD